MFLDFFHALREEKVPVTIVEWLTFLEALAKGQIRESIDDLYFVLAHQIEQQIEGTSEAF